MFSCGNSYETYSIETIDGVRYIHTISPAWGDEPKIELEFVRKIGDLDSDDDNYAFFRPMDITIDNEGNIYIVDAGNYRVQKFDSGGKYILTIGRQGQGPGELARPTTIDRDPDGNFLVMDSRNNKIQKYSADGDNLGSIRMNFRSPIFGILSTGDLVFPTAWQRQGSNPGSLFEVLDPGGKPLREFGEPVESTGNRMSAQSSMDIDPDDNVIISFVTRNRIEKYSRDGTLIFRTDRPLNYPVPDGLLMRNVTTLDEETVEIQFPTIVSFGIQFDGKGRIWDMTLHEQIALGGSEPAVVIDFHIFDKDGILLGILPVNQSFFLFRIFGDRLFTIDPNLSMSVNEYRIVER
ncbi:NHL repeat-containing protein [candidate division KSB1 bacterium]|nr:NHL repeat-containing protein [candidate division KSB1 bacterium]